MPSDLTEAAAFGDAVELERLLEIAERFDALSPEEQAAELNSLEATKHWKVENGECVVDWEATRRAKRRARTWRQWRRRIDRRRPLRTPSVVLRTKSRARSSRARRRVRASSSGQASRDGPDEPEPPDLARAERRGRSWLRRAG